MTFDTMLSLFPTPMLAPENEGGTGGGDSGDQGAQNTGGDAGTGGNPGAEDQKTDDSAGEKKSEGKSVLTGETAEGEANPDEAKDEGKKDEAAEEPVVPETYDFTELLPKDVELNVEIMAAMTPAMKDLKLTQEQANGLAKAYIEGVTKEAEQAAERVAKMMGDWVSTAKADAEIGKAKWDESVRNANAFIKKFGTPEFVQQVLVDQGMGNHPEMIRIFARAGLAVADDIAPSGEGTDTGSRATDQAGAWYGDTTPDKKRG